MSDSSVVGLVVRSPRHIMVGMGLLALGFLAGWLARAPEHLPVLVEAAEASHSVFPEPASDYSSNQDSMDGITLAEKQDELIEASRRGFWRLNKRWEVIINDLDSAEISKLVSALLEQPAGLTRNSLIATLFNRWAEVAPRAALRRVDDIADESLRQSAVDSIAQGWSYTRPAAFLTWALEQPSGTRRTAMLPRAVARVASEDPARAWEVAVKEGLLTRDTYVAREIYEAWSAIDPAAALAAIDQDLTGTHRQAALQFVAVGWGSSDPQGALAWARTLGPGQNLSFISNVIIQEARLDPVSAASHLTEFIEGPRQAIAAKYIAKQWTKIDPGAAYDWVRQLEDASIRSQALKESAFDMVYADPSMTGRLLTDLQAGLIQQEVNWIMGDIVRGAPEAAALHAISAPPSAERDQLLKDVMLRYSSANARMALGMIDRIEPGRLRDEILATNVNYLATDDPERALQQIMNIGSADIRSKALVDSTRKVAELDPDTASVFLEAIPAGNDRRRAVNGVAQGYAKRTPSAGMQWARSLPDTVERDAAYAAMARTWTAERPAAAAEAVDQISNSSNRQALVRSVGRQWMKVSPSEARRWIERSDLPENTKTQLLRDG